MLDHAIRWELSPQKGARTREPIYTRWHASHDGSWTRCGRMRRRSIASCAWDERQHSLSVYPRRAGQGGMGDDTR
jgi:hypothetical protein